MKSKYKRYRVKYKDENGKKKSIVTCYCFDEEAAKEFAIDMYKAKKILSVKLIRFYIWSF